MRPQDPFYKRV
jgi:hypothetical protein